ncbi:MAG: DUF2071 domain-containing protein, partial [Pirellulaceae bacterium]|nr:DUF2071 domain-containing protein [Pirellulaceae bacterium]
PEEDLLPLVPESLSLDLHDNAAYVSIVLFAMEGVRASWWPELMSFRFLEANVRTYVHHQGQPGIYFMSMDANHRSAVWAARRGWSLPYHYSAIQMSQQDSQTDYRVDRRRSAAKNHTRDQIGSPLGPSGLGTLEHFLLERYFLFVEHRDRLCSAQVHHSPYPAHAVELLDLQDSLVAATGLNDIPETPPLAHYAPGVDVEIFSLQPVS